MVVGAEGRQTAGGRRMLGASARGAQSFTLGRQQSSGDGQGDRNKAMLTSVMTRNCTLENGYKGNSVLYVFHLNKENFFLIDQTGSPCSVIPRRPTLSLIALAI